MVILYGQVIHNPGMFALFLKLNLVVFLRYFHIMLSFTICDRDRDKTKRSSTGYRKTITPRRNLEEQ